MSTIERWIDVAVPIRTAYNQWTQFEEFPLFMAGVDEVEQIDPGLTHWVTSIAGVRREFDAAITEQRPDQRIAWTSTTKPLQAGSVTFHNLAPDTTRIVLQMEYAPEGLAEHTGSALGLVEHRIKGDLERFKTFIESRGIESGGWRGEIPPPPLGTDTPAPHLPPDQHASRPIDMPPAPREPFPGDVWHEDPGKLH